MQGSMIAHSDATPAVTDGVPVGHPGLRDELRGQPGPCRRPGASPPPSPAGACRPSAMCRRLRGCSDATSTPDASASLYAAANQVARPRTPSGVGYVGSDRTASWLAETSVRTASLSPLRAPASANTPATGLR